MKSIAVIGGGVSGLASAARLQHQGYKVTVFEKEALAGGRMNRIEKDGYKFDLGPTIVMMPEIYRQVFLDCGKNPDEYIPIEQLTTLYDLHYPDKTISVPSDLTLLHNLLDSLEKDSADGFFKYLSTIYTRYILARDHFIVKSFRKPTDFFNPSTLIKAMQLKTFDSADHMIGQFVKNDKIKKMLAFQTLYIGISPYQGPSLYSMIPMIEMLYGVWYMKGGMRTMAEAMIKLCKEEGVELKTSAPVEKILINNGKAHGVRAGGKDMDFDIVLNTADFPYAVKNLIDDEKIKGKYTDKKIDAMDYSCSGYLLYLGLKRSLKGKIQMHNIIFSKDFDQNIADIFEGRFPGEPSIYVYAPSTVDPDLAPKGKDGIYVLVPVSETKTDKTNWDDPEFLLKVRTQILKALNRINALKDIEKDIVSETVITPFDLTRRFNAQFGAAFGLRPSLKQSNAFRPQAALKTIKNLYFAGASNHPGAGVPIVLTSAEIAVREIIKDDKQKK